MQMMDMRLNGCIRKERLKKARINCVKENME